MDDSELIGILTVGFGGLLLIGIAVAVVLWKIAETAEPGLASLREIRGSLQSISESLKTLSNRYELLTHEEGEPLQAERDRKNKEWWDEITSRKRADSSESDQPGEP